LLDGILFEKLGTPAAVICTEPFIRSAENMSVAHGFKSYPFAVMPHPDWFHRHQNLGSNGRMMFLMK
jgi:hypothetical protein